MREKRSDTMTVSWRVVRRRLELTDEMKSLSKRIEKPDDLNDALLAVHVEQYAHALALSVQRRIESQIGECL